MFLVKLFVLFIMHLTVSNADSSSLENKILYGKKVRIEDFPFFAATQGCGATILSDRWLLTAAHCVDSKLSIGNQMAFVGGDRLDNSIAVKYDRIVIHPLYTPVSYLLTNDIALLRLQTPLKFSNKIGTAKLPTYGIPSGSNLVFIGRGKNEYNMLSPSLMKMDLVTFRDQDYFSLTPQFQKLFMEHTIVCARKIDGKPGLCEGDSGSPLLNGHTVVGLASFYFGKAGSCAQSTSACYTNVTTYLPWIKSITGLY